MYNCDGNGSTLTLSSEHAEESVQKNRRQLQEQIQVKNDSLSIIFQMIYKLEYLSNKCACPDLAKDSIDQVSFLHHDAELIVDEIERMQHELNDLEYAIRTCIDVEVSRETNSSSSGDESDNDDMVDFTRQLSSSFDLEHQFSDD